MVLSVLFFALYACSEPIVASDSGADEPAAAHDTAPEADSAAPPVVTEESAGGYEVDNDWIFTKDRIHEVAITLSEESWAAIAAAPYTPAEATVSIDGIETPNVGVRLRGKIGSYRDLSGKPKFEIEFNEFNPEQRFYGLESLSLNNEVVDCGYLREPLGYRLFELAGVPALRTGFAKVTVNGAEYGLYVLLETQDDRFLKRVYEHPEGNLYDGKYVWYGGYSYTLLDFIPGLETYYELEEGTDIDNADIFAFTAAVTAAQASGDFHAGMNGVLDWPEYHRELLMEQWTGHLDGYALNTNNNRPYFDPTDGKMEILPWDLDYAFQEDYVWGMSWYTPRGVLAASCFADAACVAAHQAVAAEVAAAIDVAALDAELSAWQALTYEAAITDPRRECDVASVDAYQASLHSWIAARPAYMQTFWGY